MENDKEKNAYYRGDQVETTYLEFFSSTTGSQERNSFRLLKDQEAYDSWHSAFYLREIYSYSQLLKKKNIEFEDIPRKEKNLLVYLLGRALKRQGVVLELGSSLFEMIDGLQVVSRYFDEKKSPIELRSNFDETTFYGLDISSFLNFLAERIHPNHKVKCVEDLSLIPNDVKIDLFYDRAVASYAFGKVDDFIKIVNGSAASIINLYASKKDTFDSSRLGKTVTYFSLEELIEKSNKPIYHLFGYKSPGPWNAGADAIEGFFLICDEETAGNFSRLSKLDPNVAKYFSEKDISIKPARNLLSK